MDILLVDKSVCWPTAGRLAGRSDDGKVDSKDDDGAPSSVDQKAVWQKAEHLVESSDLYSAAKKVDDEDKMTAAATVERMAALLEKGGVEMKVERTVDHWVEMKGVAWAVVMVGPQAARTALH